MQFRPTRASDVDRIMDILAEGRRALAELGIDQWQGGDIVIFENHIGIVSDKRNGKGIAFVLHNGNPYQRYYEEDILEHRDDIVAHYRIS